MLPILDSYEDSFMMDEFRSEMAELAKKTKDPSIAQEVGYPIAYPTTFLPLDFMNGLRVDVDTFNGRMFNYDSIGLGEGTIIMVIGKTGTAKTTFVAQAATSMLRRFPQSIILHEDAEGGMSKPRIKQITGWSSRYIENHYILRQEGISSESFFQRVEVHCKKKIRASIEHPDKMMYYTGTVDIHGKPVRKIVPSVVILDSLPLLVPNSMQEDEKIAGNMSAASVAKLNAQIFRRLTPLIKAANVILFVINHINFNINLNQFSGNTTQINYLKQGELLPGGNTPLYLANNILKFVTSSKLTDEKDFGINGWHSKVEIVKSRSNRAGQTSKLVYDQEYGFNRELSMYTTLKDEGMIRGSGAWFYLDNLPSMKFQQKQFMEKLYESDMLKMAFKEMTLDWGALSLDKNTKQMKDTKQMSNDYLDDFVNNLALDLNIA